MAEVIAFPKQPRLQVTDYFGGCPHCGGTSGYVNIGRDHWFKCDKHKTKWWIGSNLFSAWRDEDEEEWRRNFYLLAKYREVEPLPCNDEDLTQYFEPPPWWDDDEKGSGHD